MAHLYLDSFGAESHHCGTGSNILALLVFVERLKTFCFTCSKFYAVAGPHGKAMGDKRAASPFLPSQGRCGMRAAPRTVVWMAGSGFVVSLRRVCLPFPSSFFPSFLPSYFPFFPSFFLFFSFFSFSFLLFLSFLFAAVPSFPLHL